MAENNYNELRLWNPRKQYTRICFTWNFPDGKTFEDYPKETYGSNLREETNCSYLLMGAEEVNRKHFQGYIEWEKKKLGSAIMKMFLRVFGQSGHYEDAKGDAEQNLIYITKQDKDAYSWGAPSKGRGRRNDLAELFDMAIAGAGDRELIATDPGRWAVHRRALTEARQLYAPKRTWPSKLIFLWGPTGTGKSMHAEELEPETMTYREPFMNGYTTFNEVILFDDFDWSKMSVKYWLKMCDRYPMTVETKGACVNFAPKTIIFTSNDDPKTWWTTGAHTAPAATLEAVHRRMDEFGTFKHLTSFVPETQRLLSDFIVKEKTETSGATRSTFRASAEGAAGVSQMDIDTESDDERPAKKTKLRDFDEHSDYSNDEYQADPANWAPGCLRGPECSTMRCMCLVDNL